MLIETPISKAVKGLYQIYSKTTVFFLHPSITGGHHLATIGLEPSKVFHRNRPSGYLATSSTISSYHVVAIGWDQWITNTSTPNSTRLGRFRGELLGSGLAHSVIVERGVQKKCKNNSLEKKGREISSTRIKQKSRRLVCSKSNILECEYASIPQKTRAVSPMSPSSPVPEVRYENGSLSGRPTTLTHLNVRAKPVLRQRRGSERKGRERPDWWMCPR